MFLAPKIKVLFSGETMRCRKVRQNLRYHVSNKLLSPEKISHHVLLLLHSFIDKKELLSGFSRSKLQKMSPGCCKHKQNKSWTMW